VPRLSAQKKFLIIAVRKNKKKQVVPTAGSGFGGGFALVPVEKENVAGFAGAGPVFADDDEEDDDDDDDAKDGVAGGGAAEPDELKDDEYFPVAGSIWADRLVFS